MHHVCYSARDPAQNCHCSCPEEKLWMAARNDPLTCGGQPGMEWSGAAGCGCDLFNIPAPRVPTAPTTPYPSQPPSKVPTTAMPSQLPPVAAIVTTTRAPTAPTTASPTPPPSTASPTP